MFETAELGTEALEGRVRGGAPRDPRTPAQGAVRPASTKFPVIIVIAGADGSGKGDTVNRLHEWLDPRGLETNVFGPPTDEERDRPALAILADASGAGTDRDLLRLLVHRPDRQARLRKDRRREIRPGDARVALFEQMLAEDGALILKFWFHLSKKAQKKRLEKLETDQKTACKVSPIDWKHFGITTGSSSSASGRSGRPTPRRPLDGHRGHRRQLPRPHRRARDARGARAAPRHLTRGIQKTAERRRR